MESMKKMAFKYKEIERKMGMRGCFFLLEEKFFNTLWAILNMTGDKAPYKCDNYRTQGQSYL